MSELVVVAPEMVATAPDLSPVTDTERLPSQCRYKLFARNKTKPDVESAFCTDKRHCAAAVSTARKTNSSDAPGKEMRPLLSAEEKKPISRWCR
ncbi:hypothetical protein C5C42_13355 [Rathayibacter sp. AY1F7]|nr:hypothetical protein C5C99_14450 [Rathayibacter sp. AY1C4]PPH31309.1 hypothetical protein C5C37_02095 [Rathayibacter sp. AY1F9]PPH43677.1 hypothetical protein C5C42_13355 [Rathayibacter sp. AY1F7]